jgi:L-ascorbate metabolism protein UlaG (beta-lactamase superfamily)
MSLIFEKSQWANILGSNILKKIIHSQLGFIISILAMPLLALMSVQSWAQQSIQVQWFGQSAFKITTLQGHVIVIDPWILKNPKTPAELKNLDALGKVDVVLVTHAHWDHTADAVEIATKNQAPLYGPGDFSQTLMNLGSLPAKQLPRMNKGGTVSPWPGVKITAVHAEHSSTYVWNNPATQKDESLPGGEPLGFVIEFENGFKIYHAGDTDVFGDMALIQKRYHPDLAMVPIGGNFTMDPQGAAYAVNEFLKPKFAIPMHYQTNPYNIGSPEDFIAAVGKSGPEVVVMKPGEIRKF